VWSSSGEIKARSTEISFFRGNSRVRAIVAQGDEIGGAFREVEANRAAAETMSLAIQGTAGQVLSHSCVFH